MRAFCAGLGATLKKLITAVAGAIVLTAVPGAVQANDFVNCDGFSAPDKKIDGMTRETLLLGLATGKVDKRAKDTVLSLNGMKACERALADPALQPSFWMRRANLEQARALHALAVNREDAATEALAASDAAGANDPYFRGSLGLGNHAIRALMAIRKGQNDAALAEIAELERVRPWSASTLKVAERLRYMIDPVVGIARMRQNLPAIPETALFLYWNNFLSGDYEAALRDAPMVSWEPPERRGQWTYAGEERAELEKFGLRADFFGSRAFALTLAGRTAEAQALLAEITAELDEAMAVPPDRAPGKPAKKADMQEWRTRLPAVQAARTQLQLWKDVPAFIEGVPAMAPDKVMDAFNTSPFRKLPIFPAVMDRINLVSPEDVKGRDQIYSEFRKEVQSVQLRVLTMSVQDLAGDLPRHLTEKMMPVMKKAGDGYFLSDTGLSKARMGKGDVWTIRFEHRYAPMHLVEEMAMYGAALTAIDQGKDSMAVLARRSATLSTTNVSYYGRVGSTRASGYEAQLRVHFFDSGNPPAELVGMEPLTVRAADVVAVMSERYRQSDGITIAW